MKATKQRIHTALVTVTFDKPCTRKVAIRELKDTIHGENYTTPQGDDEPEKYSIRSVRRACGAAQPQPRPELLEEREIATIIAALRFWQRTALAAEQPNPEDIIASKEGTLALMQPAEIDALIEKINV